MPPTLCHETPAEGSPRLLRPARGQSLKHARRDKTVWNVPENVTPLPGFTHPGAWLNLLQKLPNADKGGSPTQDRTWGSAGAGGARPSAAGGRDTGP